MGGRGEWLGEWEGYVAHTMGVFLRRRTVRAGSIVIRILIRILFLAIWGR